MVFAPICHACLANAIDNYHSELAGLQAATIDAERSDNARDRVFAGLASARVRQSADSLVMALYAESGLVDDGDFMGAWDAQVKPDPVFIGGRLYSVSFADGPGPNGEPKLVIATA